MEITQLQYFVEVYKCNSFTEAAENCHITAQGLSMSINRLESELGLKLFRRTPKGVFPTNMGEYLYPRAQEVTKIINECEIYFANNSETRRSVTAMFTLGTVELFAHTAIPKFKENHPYVSLYLHNGTDSECESALLDGKVEFALCAGPIDTQKFNATLLFSGKHVLVVNNKHPMASKKVINISELKNVPLSLRTKATKSTKTLISLCNEAGFEPHIFSYVDDLRLAVYLAEINQCCGVMNLTTAEKIATPNLCLIPFECQEMDWNIYLVKNKRAIFTKEARDLENVLLQIND